MKALRGKGEFVSVAGVVWRVELWAEDYTGAPVDMSFPRSNPLEIVWGGYDRIEPVEGATATLRVISESDREWVDLYSVERTRVRLDVYRDGALYWQGTLDSEFYEEPFEVLQGYEVALTFSDLGVLEDIDFDMSGTVTLAEVIARGVELAGLTIGVDESLISTSFPDGEPLTLSALSVRSDNFYDEDNEATSYKEAITDVLQPLALKIRQRGGKFIIYDFNALYERYSKGGAELLSWEGDSQTMAVADVAQKIRVSFSPYGQTELLTDTLEYTGNTSADVRNEHPGGFLSPEFGDAFFYTYFNDYTARLNSSDENIANEYEDFNLFESKTQGRGLAEIHPEAHYAKFVPIFGNVDERACVAWVLTVGQGDLFRDLTKTEVNRIIHRDEEAWCTRGSDKIILRTKRVYVAGYTPKSLWEVKRYLRLTLPLLMDARYNPFDSKSDNKGNEKQHDYYYKTRTGYMFIPVGVTIYDSPIGGKAICHYDNSRVAATTSPEYVGNGEWVEGEARVGNMWLEYYSTSDLKEDAGIRGWKENRTLIGRPEKKYAEYIGAPVNKTRYKDLTQREKKLAPGEYINYPEQGGWLEVVVYEGFRGFDYNDGDSFESSKYWDGQAHPVFPDAWYIYPQRRYLRWLMYGAPTIDLVSGNGNIEKEDVDDIEYSGWIERTAKEELSVSTTYGTVVPPEPGARGAIIRTATGAMVSELSRAGVTDVPERLLIGTAISQYSDRRLKFTGDARIIPGDALVCRERLHADRLFWFAGERHDVIEDVSEADIVEINEENYEAIEEVE